MNLLDRLRGGPKRTARPDEWSPPSAAIQGDIRAIVEAVVGLTPRQAEDLDAVLEQLGPIEVGSLTTARVREMMGPRADVGTHRCPSVDPVLGHCRLPAGHKGDHLTWPRAG